MGQNSSQFTERELEDYQDLTYFTKKEILYAHGQFEKLDPESVGRIPNAKLPMDRVLSLPELNANPFGDRMCQVFSSSKDGDCTFEDFLDMMSVFSDMAPRSVKIAYAFKMFDFDTDGYLGRGDISKVVCRLVGGRTCDEPASLGGETILTDAEVNSLVAKIINEADLDDDGCLAFAEFEHVMSKAPDFMTAFRIRLQ